MRGILFYQLFSVCLLVVVWVEAGGDGAAEECEFTAGIYESPLPGVFGDKRLNFLFVEDIVAERDNFTSSVGVQL